MVPPGSMKHSACPLLRALPEATELLLLRAGSPQRPLTHFTLCWHEGREQEIGKRRRSLPPPSRTPQRSLTHLPSAWASCQTSLVWRVERATWEPQKMGRGKLSGYIVPPHELFGQIPILPLNLGSQTLPEASAAAYQDCCTPWCHWWGWSPQDRLGSSDPCVNTGPPDTWCRSCG